MLVSVPGNCLLPSAIAAACAPPLLESCDAGIACSVCIHSSVLCTGTPWQDVPRSFLSWVCARVSSPPWCTSRNAFDHSWLTSSLPDASFALLYRSRLMALPTRCLCARKVVRTAGLVWDSAHISRMPRKGSNDPRRTARPELASKNILNMFGQREMACER